MSQNEKVKNFETIIDVIDPSGDFESYWKTSMKEHLNDTFCSIGLMKKSTLKSLSSLSLNLRINKEESTVNEVESLFTMNIVRITKESDINGEDFKKFKEKMKQTQLLVAMMTISESTEKAIQNATKFIEKVKKEQNIDLVLLPYTNNVNGHVFTAIENFFKKDFKQKITVEFNKKLIYYSQYFENAANDKELYNSNEEKLYEYLQNKQNYFNYLSLGEFHAVVLSQCKEDLFKSFKYLNKQYAFTEPFSIAEFNEKIISQKIKDKTLCNLEYQQFLFYNYMKSCKIRKDYTELNDFISKITTEIAQFTTSFKSMFHFYFWNFLFTQKILAFYKTLKKSNSKNDGDVIMKGQISILYYMKKIMKNYAISAKIEIPNEKIFTLALNSENSKEISTEMNSALNSINEEIENNQQYLTFIDDVKENFKDEKTKNIFMYQKTFFEEYLTTLKTLNKIHTELGQNNLSIRVRIESIPIYFALSKFDEVKKELIALMEKEELKEQKWEYIYEYLNFGLIILLNCLERNNDNLTLLLKSIDIKMNKISELIKIVGSDNINLISEIISKFIDSYDINLNNLPAEFNMNKIIDISFRDKENKILYTNSEANENFDIDCDIINNTGFFFNVEKIKLKFNEIFTGEQIDYEIVDDIKKISSFTPKDENKFTIKNVKSIFKNNSIYELKEIHFVVKNGICGIFHVKASKTIKINIKTIDTEIFSSLYPSYDTSTLTSEYENVFYFNILSTINLSIANIPKDMSDKSIAIEIVDEDKDEKSMVLKIAKKVFMSTITECKIDVTQKKIVFPKGELTEEKYKKMFQDNVMKIPFVVEDINYYTNGKKNIKIVTSIIQNDTLLYAFAQRHTFSLSHLFSLNEKFRLMKNKIILMQTTFSLNLEISGIKIYLNNENKNVLALEQSQAINFVLSFKNDLNEISNMLWRNFLQFSIESEANKYRLCYPEEHIIDEVKQILDMPYYVEINIENAEHKIFEEFSVNVSIKKFFDKKTMLMVKMKESDNWSVIGKSKLIENLQKGKCELNVQFKLFPLQDGYLKIPEIEFMEYEINEEEGKEKTNTMNNINFLEFAPIKFGTVIEGNERIVKINSINSCTLRLNLT